MDRPSGGDWVSIGHGMEAAEWNALVDTALAGPDGWVVQRLASIAASEFPVVSADGVVRVEPFHTVMGFAPRRYGLGIVGRASQKQAVNVAQRGGMCGILIGRPPWRLVGPTRRDEKRLKPNAANLRRGVALSSLASLPALCRCGKCA